MNKLGFGYLRLPKIDEELDYNAINEITDAYLAAGGRYIDTAYSYLGVKVRKPSAAVFLQDIRATVLCWRQSWQAMM